MAKKIGRWGIARKFFVGDPSKGVPKLGSVTASAFKSGQEVVFADDSGGKVAANLNQTVSNKINNSLQLPADAPATEKLVAIGVNGAQKLVDPPSGGITVYQDFIAMTYDTEAGDYVQRLNVTGIPAQGDFRVVMQIGRIGQGYTVNVLGNTFDLSQIFGTMTNGDLTLIAGYENGERFTKLYNGAIECEATSTGSANRSISISPKGPNAYGPCNYTLIY